MGDQRSTMPAYERPGVSSMQCSPGYLSYRLQKRTVLLQVFSRLRRGQLVPCAKREQAH